MKFNRYVDLEEGKDNISLPKLWLHGDRNKRTSFKDQKMDRDPYGNDSPNESGPGIYFTQLLSEARNYAAPDGFIYQCEITPNKVLTLNTKNSKIAIEKLISWAEPENLKKYLENWDENPKLAFRKAVSNMVNHYSKLIDAAWTISNDEYAYDPNGWANSMLNLGYDAFYNEKRDHLIVYNPKIIRIVKEIPYGTENDEEL